MPYKITGWNSFYEGWLARCFEQSYELGQVEAWREGWKTADETDKAGRMIALSEEIRIGQTGIVARVIVEKTYS